MLSCFRSLVWRQRERLAPAACGPSSGPQHRLLMAWSDGHLEVLQPSRYPLHPALQVFGLARPHDCRLIAAYSVLHDLTPSCQWPSDLCCQVTSPVRRVKNLRQALCLDNIDIETSLCLTKSQSSCVWKTWLVSLP